MKSALIDLPAERTEFSDDGYSALGRALTFATAFEATCRCLSSLQQLKVRQKDLQKSSPEGTDVFAVAVDEIWGQRLRQHIKKISEHQEWRFSSEIAESLAKAKKARNQVAHEVSLALPAVIETDAGRTEFIERLASLTKEIAIGFLIVELTTLIETQQPIPSPEFLIHYTEKIVRWVIDL